MRLLRTISTQRLLAILLGLVIAIVGGTAIALAASGNGPVPPRTTLANAIHKAMRAPALPGISAQISFTNNLISSSDIQGPTDPLLQGASGRLWLSPSTHQLRIELQSDNGDGQVVVNGSSFWVYDPATHTAYQGTLPAHSQTHSAKAHKNDTMPSVSQIQTQLNQLMQHANLSGAIPGDVAGQAAYTVQVSPKHDGGLLGDAQLAFDAARGVPLSFAVYARGDSTPVLQLKATGISFGSIPASDFAIRPPSGAKIVKVATPASTASKGTRAGKHAKRHLGTNVSGAAAVARRVPFALNAPRSLVGLPRQSVTLLDWSGHPAALVTFGQNLGGVAVIEQSASGSHGLPSGSIGGGQGSPGLNLPSVSINGQTARELSTALGTVLTFTRGRVSYTVLGSVPPAAAEAAARAL
jgi:outer membrane lipoprotein-sorting protein